MAHDEKASTLGFDDESLWAPPVEEVADLWTFAVEGQRCFVKSEDRVYQRQGPDWVPVRKDAPPEL